MSRRSKKLEGETPRVEVVNSAGLRWQPIAKSLREIDEEKIKEAKEDVDTLLVFSGLFSAVLSAFLVETYQKLLPDKEDRMISLLETIANQNYTLSPGSLTVTAVVSDDTFQVPEWALRVNVLWFSSLIVSLATASLGMLVKSWLHEYLSLDTEAPRERLRIRFYREPAMKQWRVYEIVSILPLLLQVALGLFFIGLCFFTGSVNHRLNLASLPLVLAWAFLLLLTILGPLFSPRCPFKVHVLKRYFRGGRPFIRPFIRLARYQVATANNGLTSLFHTISSHAWRMTTGTRHEALEPLHETGASAQNRYDDHYEEEDDIMKREDHDIDVLIAADLVMADDSLIDAMGEVLKQRHDKELKETVRFISELVKHRDGVIGHSGSIHHNPEVTRHALTVGTVTAPLSHGLPMPVQSGTPIPASQAVVSIQTQLPASQIALRPGEDVANVFPDLRTLSRRAFLAIVDILADAMTDLASTASSVNGTATTTHLDNKATSCPVRPMIVGIEPATMPTALSSVVEDPNTEGIVPSRSTAELSPLITGQNPVHLPGDENTSSAPLQGREIEPAVSRPTPIPQNSSDGISDWARQAALFLLSDSLYVHAVELDDIITAQLCYSLKDFLRDGRCKPELSIEMILRLLARRSNALNIATPDDILNLADISRQAYVAMMDIVSSAIQRGRMQGSTESWIGIARVILFARTTHHYKISDLVDDQLVLAVCESLRHPKSNLRLTTVINSVQRLIEHRLGNRPVELHDRISMPNLSALSYSTYCELMRIIVDALRTEVNREDSRDEGGWRAKAGIFLLSDTPIGSEGEPLDSYVKNDQILDDATIQTLCSAVGEAGLRPGLTLGFVINMLKHRFSKDIRPYNMDYSLTLDLTQDVYLALIGLVTTLLSRSTRDTSFTDSDKQYAIVLLLSKYGLNPEKQTSTPFPSELVPLMCEAAKSLADDASTLIQFSLRIIGNQTGWEAPEGSERLHVVLDVELLHGKVYDTIMCLVADTLSKNWDGPLTRSGPVWVYATMILLSETSRSLPARAAVTLRRMLVNDSSDGSATLHAVGRLLKGSIEASSSQFRPMSKKLLQAFSDSSADAEYTVPIDGLLTSVK